MQLQDYTIIGISKYKLAVLNYYNELQKKLVDIRNKKPLFVKNDKLDSEEKLTIEQINQILINRVKNETLFRHQSGFYRRYSSKPNS